MTAGLLLAGLISSPVLAAPAPGGDSTGQTPGSNPQARSPEPMEETAPAAPAAGRSAPLRGSFVSLTAGSRVERVPLDRPAEAEVVIRPLADAPAPAALVDRALAEQPVHPYLIEVRLVNTTVYLDPQADYQHKRVGSLDENHFILRAQRLYQSLGGEPARVIYGSRARRPLAGGPGGPAVVLLKPGILGPQQQIPGEDRTPSVPQAPDR
jgi:hypothetical protein